MSSSKPHNSANRNNASTIENRGATLGHGSIPRGPQQGQQSGSMAPPQPNTTRMGPGFMATRPPQPVPVNTNLTGHEFRSTDLIGVGRINDPLMPMLALAHNNWLSIRTIYQKLVAAQKPYAMHYESLDEPATVAECIKHLMSANNPGEDKLEEQKNIALRRQHWEMITELKPLEIAIMKSLEKIKELSEPVAGENGPIDVTPRVKEFESIHEKIDAFTKSMSTRMALTDEQTRLFPNANDLKSVGSLSSSLLSTAEPISRENRFRLILETGPIHMLRVWHQSWNDQLTQHNNTLGELVAQRNAPNTGPEDVETRAPDAAPVVEGSRAPSAEFQAVDVEESEEEEEEPVVRPSRRRVATSPPSTGPMTRKRKADVLAAKK